MTNREIEIICEVCPTSCLVRAVFKGNELVEVSGNKCEKGEHFVIEETRNPMRILTTTVKVLNGEREVVPVKTDRPIARTLLAQAVKELARTKLEAPVEFGQIIIENLLSTGAKVMATRRIARVTDSN